jgi:hypothetical protein
MPTSCASKSDHFERLGALSSARVIAIAGAHAVKGAKVKGEGVWLCQAGEDALSPACNGKPVKRYRDRSHAVLIKADFHVLTRAVEQVTAAPAGAAEHAFPTPIAEQLAPLRAPSQETRQQETKAQWPSKS